jgi:hypothetical protein
MTLYRVVSAVDTTTWEAVGEEIRRLHRSSKGAQDAIASMNWDDDWGKKPVLEVAEVTKYESLPDAREDGWEVVK